MDFYYVIILLFNYTSVINLKVWYIVKVSFIEPTPELTKIVKKYIIIESLEAYEKLWILPSTGKLIFFNSGIDLFINKYHSDEEMSVLPKEFSVTRKVDEIIQLSIGNADVKFPLFGVELLSTACTRLFSFDNRVVTESHVLLENCLNPTGVSFENLYEIDDIDEQVSYIEKGFLSLKAKAYPVESTFTVIENIIEYILETLHKVNVSDILEKFEYSRTSLERDFKKTTGYTAKEYIQIMRFCDIFKDLIVNGYDFMTLEYKFFDQSHMNKAFKKFIDIPPSKLQAFVKKNNIEIYQLQKTYE